MDIIKMPIKIGLIADGMFPKPALPLVSFGYIPRSDFTRLLVDIRSPGSIALEKADLIKCQRVEKSQSSGGNIHKLGNRSLRCQATWMW
jgi:hypothetical protein